MQYLSGRSTETEKINAFRNFVHVLWVTLSAHKELWYMCVLNLRIVLLVIGVCFHLFGFR